MNRFHVNLVTQDLDRSVAFYRALFNAEPTVKKSDYAKWMLDEPALNFAITSHGTAPGVDHVGLQFESAEELAKTRERLAALTDIADQNDVECCYAQSTKAWARDPNGLAWEGFVTSGQVEHYGDGSATSAKDALAAKATRCCDAQQQETTTTHCC